MMFAIAGLLFCLSGLLWSISGLISGKVNPHIPIAMMLVCVGLMFVVLSLSTAE